jgi:SAM-dependent methyltransferase
MGHPATPVNEYSEHRYLLSKQTVDDRALHRGVLAELETALGELGRAPRVLELGAGVGTMLPRLAKWAVLGGADYTLLDRDASALAEARRELSRAGHGEPRAGDALGFTLGSARFDVRFVCADALEFSRRQEHERRFDLVIANAVLDLLDLGTTLPALFRVLEPRGLYWFSLNFDGETILLPELPLDTELMRAYHRTMDERVIDGKPSGDSRSGRHLLELLPKTGATLLAAGSSDWVVFPRSGGYAADEAYFLHHIVHTIDSALTAAPGVDAATLRAWVETRHAQIDRAELIYIAHQLDAFGRAP